MMKLYTFKRAAALLLALTLLCALLPHAVPAVRAATYSGSCGDNLTWSFNTGTGKLSIQGSGEMEDYYFGDAPWEAYRESIKTVSLPQGLRSVGDGAFISCVKLRSVNIPDTVTRIGFHAFSRCESLEAITIPDSVTVIGDDAFSDCVALSAVTIPGSVTDFGEFAFESCTGLKTVTLGEGLLTVSAHAFQGCSGLTEIHFSDTVQYLENYAFYGCKALTEVTIPDSILSLGSAVFGGCTGLINIRVEENNPAYSAENGILFSLDGSILVQYPAGRSGSYAIPNTVSVIGEGAFDGCKGLSAVTIPGSVISIERDAFSFCEGLTQIDLPISVHFIGACAFEFCTALTEFTVPANVRDVNDYTFYSCQALTDVTIRDGVGSIGMSAFEGCTELLTVTIPRSVTSIGDMAFTDCDKLTIRGYTGSTAEAYAAANGIPFIALSEDLVSGVCGDYLAWSFNPETGALRIEGSGDMWDFWTSEEAPWKSFRTQLKSVSLPERLTRIGADAFRDCTGLTSIVIPGSVDSIGPDAFYGCSGLKSVSFGEGLRVIGEQAFIYCSSLPAVTLPESLEMLGMNAFQDCSALRQIVVRNPACEIGAAQECGARGVEYDVETENTLGSPEQTAIYVVHDAEKENADVFPRTLDTVWGPLVYGFRYAESYAKHYGYTVYRLGAFSDVAPYSWYELPVAWAYGREITAGTGDGRFAPDQPCTREQIVTFLWKACDTPNPNGTALPFADVEPDSYFRTAVQWAYNHEPQITSGTGDGKFGVGRACTRDQVVTFLWNAAGRPEPLSDRNPFTDVKKTDYFYKAVLWALENGITSGTGPSSFGPTVVCTRSQVVTFLYKAVAILR